MSEIPHCPKCQSEYTYEDGTLYICPACSHEWLIAGAVDGEGPAKERIFRDAHGNVLVDGDTVSVIKDLKIGGSSDVVKVGTKVKNIRLVDGEDGHDIDCKIPGFGAMQLKSQFVKKSN